MIYTPIEELNYALLYDSILVRTRLETLSEFRVQLFNIGYVIYFIN